MARAPAAIRAAQNTIVGGVGGAVASGIVGDAAHSYGYHRARNEVSSNDYSVVLAADRDGPADAASALDISLPPGEMVAVTARLRAAAEQDDPRLYGLREFAGTLDGRTTFNRDLSNGSEGFGRWDSSHLWHIHLSGYRRYADDPAAWAAIADVFTDNGLSGGALSEEDDFMSALSYDEQRRVLAFVDKNQGADGRTMLQVIASYFDGNTASGNPDVDSKSGVLPLLLRLLGPVELTNSAVGQLLGRPVAGSSTASADPAEVAKLVVQMLGADLAAQVAPLLTVVAKDAA